MSKDDPLSKLREPFPPNQISKLPKESRSQIDARKADRNVAINCDVCGGWHHKHAVHLDYVGHAALTDRLLDTDIQWSWEPVSFGPDGLPAFDRNGGLWIKLTVGGVTRLGYGSADGKSGGDAVKEIIGDALRNAAMRFGAALDLWHKGDLHADEPEPETDRRDNNSSGSPEQDEGYVGVKGGKMAVKAVADQFVRDLHACADQDMLAAFVTSPAAKRDYNRIKREWPGYLSGAGFPPEFVGIDKLIAVLKAELPTAGEMMEAAE